MQVFNSDQLVELKYCERCGGLWLRSKGNAGIYCSPCDREMAEYPAARATTRRGGPRSGRPRAIRSTGCPMPSTALDMSWSGSVL
jgi:hypothetical protein